MEDVLKRKENETNFEQHKRLVYGKLVDKTLSDKDYVELAKYVYGKEYSSDVARRMMYGSRYTLELLEKEQTNNITDDKILKEIKIKTEELQKERFKYFDQKREFKSGLREEARADYIKESIFNLVNNINNIKPLNININKEYNNSDNEGVLIISDWHAGIACSNAWNEYNTNILYRRIKKLVEKTIEYGIKNKIKTLNIFNLSDLCNGIIHITTRISNNENIIEQTQLVAEILSDMLVKFANIFEEVKFYTVVANHERVMANKKESLYDENFAMFIPWYLKARLNNINNIKIIDNEFDNGIIVANVVGNTIFGTHGDLDKINNIVQNLTLMIKQFPQYIFMSHIHHHEEKEVQGVEVIVNSSLSGVDEYAKNLRLISKPSQKFMVFNKEGRECTYNILLK